MRRTFALALLVTGAACQADGGGQQVDRPNVATANPAYRAEMSDADILTLVSQLNGAEITSSKAALAKLQDPSAIQFAQQLAADHMRMDRALDSLPVKRDTAARAPAQFVTLRVASNVRGALLMTMPAGPAYDRTWATIQVNAHGDALDSLRTWQAVAKDAAVRSALGAAIQGVSQHLDRARALQSSLGAGGANTDTLPKGPLPKSENPVFRATEKPAPGATATPTVPAGPKVPKKVPPKGAKPVKDSTE